MDDLEMHIRAMLVGGGTLFDNRADALVAIYLSNEYNFRIDGNGSKLYSWSIDTDHIVGLLTNPQQYIANNQNNGPDPISMLRSYRRIKANLPKLTNQYTTVKYSYFATSLMRQHGSVSGLLSTNLFMIAPEHYSGQLLLGALEAAMILIEYAGSLHGGPDIVVVAARKLIEIMTEIAKRGGFTTDGQPAPVT